MGSLRAPWRSLTPLRYLVGYIHFSAHLGLVDFSCRSCLFCDAEHLRRRTTESRKTEPERGFNILISEPYLGTELVLTAVREQQSRAEPAPSARPAGLSRTSNACPQGGIEAGSLSRRESFQNSMEAPRISTGNKHLRCQLF